MQEIGRKLFAKIHKQKTHVHHNNEIHYMAREIEEWLPQGIQSMTDGSYSPRCLKRYYFQDEIVALRIIPHPRTLRKARMQVQQMVTIGLSTKLIRRYLH